MPTATEFTSKGQASRIENGLVVFAPSGTNYEHHVQGPDGFAPRIPLIRAAIRVKARKVYTVTSGGNFVQPILGTPRIIQGRVKMLDQRTLIVQAGAIFLVELPIGEDTIDLHNGDIQIGSLVNVVALPGASIEVA